MIPRAALFCSLFLAFGFPVPGQSDYFRPAHRLVGIGAGRADLSPEMLSERSRLMEESQTFFFLREPQAITGAERIEKLSPIFDEAARQSGLSASLIKAIAYLESSGDPLAVSPGGCCRGVMQVSAPTGREMGLRMIYATRYRTVTERKAVKNKKGKLVYTNVRRRARYQVLIEDERLVPEKAIPKAANYLARLAQDYGGLDWAIFAYHCGVGCVGNMRTLSQRARDMDQPMTVARMFFANGPGYNRELYEEIRRQMERDWSPTYWFRVMRAEQLLKMYREDRATFLELARYYRAAAGEGDRPQHRLAVWLRTEDVPYQSRDDVRKDGGKLAHALDDPEYFGFRIDRTDEDYRQDTPAALGTLTYIAYETRRLHETMKTRGEKFVPLDVVSLVRPVIDAGSSDESLEHSSGQVFDIRYANLPPGEKEALMFVLEDMGYEGYLGFIDEAPNTGVMHIGCSPSSRDFFSKVYADAAGAHRST